jgi:preprotein translocase subunit SecG
MFGTSSNTNPLTKVTAVLAAVFLILSLSITYISRSSLNQESPVEQIEIEESGILPEDS